MIRLVPVDSMRSDWPRLVANAVNSLVKLANTPQDGATRYTAPDGLQYYDGTDGTWKDVP